MTLLRKHWFDLGGLLALVAAVYLVTRFNTMTTQQKILWLSLISLFIHQLEEYRYPGYFPGMVNAAVYGSNQPDRYPLNTQTSLIVNVVMGWAAYLLAALFGDQFKWLGIGTVLISLGNFFAHTLFFNIKGKTFYNPGILTGIVLFLPVAIWYYSTLIADPATRLSDWLIGIPLGVVLNYLGIVKLIDWMADRNTTYVFENRQLRPVDRLAERRSG
ncbi:HXXEE domain-containing protein [Mucilaginibacter sp. dw_454]|uniref:HXXEE domain-containing protein n=1 Tax=Mucilaginibacter sp. dw_454 TaxID=2720079 RepID=UPI001BD5C80E|nr:HXXEE domain-containing protein [Mucilaginibacter sp. dw_454]